MRLREQARPLPLLSTHSTKKELKQLTGTGYTKIGVILRFPVLVTSYASHLSNEGRNEASTHRARRCEPQKAAIAFVLDDRRSEGQGGRADAEVGRVVDDGSGQVDEIDAFVDDTFVLERVFRTRAVDDGLHERN